MAVSGPEDTGHTSQVRLGVSGHQVLPVAATKYVCGAIKALLSDAGENLVGVTSLAAGSDQLFARLVLAAGGQLHAVLPSQHYEETFTAEDREEFERLIALAETHEVLPFDAPSEQAFYAAGRRVVDLCDRLVAVWDGQPSRGLGGTADVVAYAQREARDVQVIWPAGVVR